MARMCFESPHLQGIATTQTMAGVSWELQKVQSGKAGYGKQEVLSHCFPSSHVFKVIYYSYYLLLWLVNSSYSVIWSSGWGQQLWKELLLVTDVLTNWAEVSLGGSQSTWPMLNTGTNPTTDMKQFTRSNALSARLPTLVRLAGRTQDWLNTNEPQEKVMPSSIHHQLTNHNIDWTLLNA